jgi:hypothetical protein
VPILQYFGWVGASLLALLFLADTQLPRPELRKETPHHANIRIASNVTGPQAVTFSGRTIDYGVAPAMQVVDFSDPRRQAFAQAAPPPASPQAAPQSAAKADPQKSRKRYARRKIDPASEPPRLVEVWGWPRLQ